MKLIRIHIDHFGCLSDYRKEFTDGLNVMELGNGWGKSTLCAFLRIMFYGFETDGKRSALERERSRFAPWQGGGYGGSLTFEAGGKRYRVERTFGEKKSADTFALFDDITGLPSHDYTENIGRELFGIDQASFLRTVCQEQLHVRTDVTPGITAKIGGVEGDETDMARYGAAQEKLGAMALALSPSRKTGEIYRLRDEAAQLAGRAAARPAREAELAALLAEEEAAARRREELAEEEKALQAEQEAVSAWQEGQAKRERLEGLLEEVRAAEAKRDALLSSFPGEVPDREVIDSIVSAASSQDAVMAERNAYRLSETEEAWLAVVEDRLSTVEADEDLPDRLEEDLAHYEEVRGEWQAIALTPEEEKLLRAETRLFAKEDPDPAVFADMAGRWEKNGAVQALAEEKGRQIEDLRTQRETLQAVKDTTGLGVFAGIFVLAAGILACFMWSRPAGVAIAVAGLILAVALYAAGKRGADDRAARLKDLTERESAAAAEKEKAEAETNRLEEQTRAVYERIEGLPYRRENIIANLYKLRDTAAQYHELSAKREKAENSAAKRETEIREQALTESLGGYASCGFAEGIALLRRDREDAERLSLRRENEAIAQEKYEKQEGMISRFLERYGFHTKTDAEAQVMSIRQMSERLQQLTEEVAAREERVADFGGEVDLDALRALPASMPGRPLSAISERQSVLRAEERALQQEAAARGRAIDEAEDRLEELAADEEKAGELKGRIDELTGRYELLTETSKRLEEAKNRFTNRYVEPVREAFEQYYGMLSPEDGRRYRLSADLQLTMVDGGITRDTGFLSEGIQDLVGLCRRLAMTDAMYGQEKPFLILDDPLVNLDDEKMQGGFSFLHRVAGRYQVLYFTCHTSRVP